MVPKKPAKKMVGKTKVVVKKKTPTRSTTLSKTVTKKVIPKFAAGGSKLTPGGPSIKHTSKSGVTTVKYMDKKGNTHTKVTRSVPTGKTIETLKGVKIADGSTTTKTAYSKKAATGYAKDKKVSKTSDGGTYVEYKTRDTKGVLGSQPTVVSKKYDKNSNLVYGNMSAKGNSGSSVNTRIYEKKKTPTVSKSNSEAAKKEAANAAKMIADANKKKALAAKSKVVTGSTTSKKTNGTVIPRADKSALPPASKSTAEEQWNATPRMDLSSKEAVPPVRKTMPAFVEDPARPKKPNLISRMRENRLNRKLAKMNRKSGSVEDQWNSTPRMTLSMNEEVPKEDLTEYRRGGVKKTTVGRKVVKTRYKVPVSKVKKQTNKKTKK